MDHLDEAIQFAQHNDNSQAQTHALIAAAQALREIRDALVQIANQYSM